MKSGLGDPFFRKKNVNYTSWKSNSNLTSFISYLLCKIHSESVFAVKKSFSLGACKLNSPSPVGKNISKKQTYQSVSDYSVIYDTARPIINSLIERPFYVFSAKQSILSKEKLRGG